MPGENLESAINEALSLKEIGISTIFTQLGENISDLTEAQSVADHYMDVLDSIADNNLPSEISIKLTQIGFDLFFEQTLIKFKMILRKARDKNIFVWIDMEHSSYVERTLEFYRKVKLDFSNVGICLQSYLYRTKEDLEKLFEISPVIRLVKGAYKEPVNVAFKDKSKVDRNFFELAKLLLGFSENENFRAAYATHDMKLIHLLSAYMKAQGIHKEKIEFQMLYGIKNNEQLKLAKEGYNIRVLISYGKAWFPWYMRRLAERPGNIGFVLKSLFNK